MTSIHFYQSIYSIVEEILMEHGIDAEAIALDANLSNDLGLDSLEMNELIMEIETYFRVTIPFEQLEQQYKTVEDLVIIIAQLTINSQA